MPIRSAMLPSPRRPTGRRAQRPAGPAQPAGPGRAARGKRLIRLAALTAALALPAAGLAAASTPPADDMSQGITDDDVPF